MKLVVQMPCLNEEATLPLVLRISRKKIDGIDEINILVIDDGSTDGPSKSRTARGETLRAPRPQTRVARSFHDGVDTPWKGADIVVNTDGDNQYPQDRIADLVRPIVDGARRHRHRRPPDAEDRALLALQKADAADRQQSRKFGCRDRPPDAASGFRAYSRESLMRLNTMTHFSYCTETIIQAGNKRMRIEESPSRRTRRPASRGCSRTSFSTWPGRARRSCAAT